MGNEVFQFRALPFGLATAPVIFTRVMNVVAAYAHVQGIKVHMYLDNWLLRALERLELVCHMHWLRSLYHASTGSHHKYTEVELSASQGLYLLRYSLPNSPIHLLPLIG